MGSIGRDKLTGEGPQGDMSDETRQRIFNVKPTALAKFNKGEATFNAFELYESDDTYRSQVIKLPICVSLLKIELHRWSKPLLIGC